jgi:hypothetical protein
VVSIRNLTGDKNKIPACNVKTDGTENIIFLLLPVLQTVAIKPKERYVKKNGNKPFVINTTLKHKVLIPILLHIPLLRFNSNSLENRQ